MKKPVCSPDPDYKAISAESFDHLYGATVIVSVSGGKDSTALCLHLKEIGIEHSRVFADTGWEHPAVYEHLDYLETVLGPIDRVKSDVGGMEDWVRKKKMFPTRIARWCTEKLKVIPLQNYFKAIDGDPISVVGIRGQESSARAKMPEWEWSDGFDCWIWRPLLDWTTENVIDAHTRHGVKPCSLYLDNDVDRVGCWPCIHSSKKELKTISRVDPGRIDYIEALEAEATELKREVYASRGEDFDTPGNAKPTFFYQSMPGSTQKRAVPIREAVEWANTSRGGRQTEMFYDHSGGCMRWGLCETSGEPPPSSEPDISEPE